MDLFPLLLPAVALLYDLGGVVSSGSNFSSTGEGGTIHSSAPEAAAWRTLRRRERERKRERERDNYNILFQKTFFSLLKPNL